MLENKIVFNSGNGIKKTNIIFKIESWKAFKEVKSWCDFSIARRKRSSGEETMVVPGGYSGRIVRYDLTKENAIDLPWEKDEILPVIGGRGLIALLLHSLLPPGVNPLGPENALIFANGPFSGTNVPFSGRWSLGAKSPLTGFLSSGNAGGRFGTVLKWAGLDALVISGKASARSYLLVDQGRFSLRSL